MAKAAKAAASPDISEREAQKFRRDILARYENIETARGKFMNLARREREGMQGTYEALAQRYGISQKASRTNIKIVMALEKIKGWMAELELEDRKNAQRLAKAQDDKKQLLLWADLPRPTKKELRAAAKAAEEREAQVDAPKATTDELSQAAPAGTA